MSPYTLVFKLPLILFVAFNGRTCGLHFPLKSVNDRSILVEGDGEHSDTIGISLLHKDPVKRWKRLSVTRVKVDEKVEHDKHPEAIQGFRKHEESSGLGKPKQRIVYKQKISGNKERRYFISRHGTTDSVDPTLQANDDVRKEESIHRSGIRKNSSSYFRRVSRTTVKPLSLGLPVHSSSTDDMLDRHSTVMNGFGKNIAQGGSLLRGESGAESHDVHLMPALDTKSHILRPEEALAWTRNGSVLLGQLDRQDRIFIKGKPVGVMKRNKTVQKSFRRRKVEGRNRTAPNAFISDHIKVSDDFPKLWKLSVPPANDSGSEIHTSNHHEPLSPTVHRQSHESSTGHDAVSSNDHWHQPTLSEYKPRGTKISKRRKSKGESHSTRKSDAARSKASKLSSSQLDLKRVDASTQDEPSLRKSSYESTNIYSLNDFSRQEPATLSSISLLSTSKNGRVNDDISARESLDSLPSSWMTQVPGNRTTDLHSPHALHQHEQSETRSHSEQPAKIILHHDRGSEHIPGPISTVQSTIERSKDSPDPSLKGRYTPPLGIPNQYPQQGQQLTHTESSLEKNSPDKVHVEQKDEKRIDKQGCKCKQILDSLSQSMFNSPLLPFPENTPMHFTSTEKPTEHDTSGNHWKVSSHEKSTGYTSPTGRHSSPSGRRILGDQEEIMPHKDGPSTSTVEPEKASQPVSTRKPAADVSKDGRGVYLRKTRVNQQNPNQYSQVISKVSSKGRRRPQNFGNVVSYSNGSSLTPTVITVQEDEDGGTVSQTIIKGIKQPKAGSYEIRTGGDQIQRPTIYQTEERVGVAGNREYNKEIFSLEHNQETENREHSQRPLNRVYSQGPSNTEYTQVTLNREQSQRPQNRESSQGQVVHEYDQVALKQENNHRPQNQEYTQVTLNREYKQGPGNRQYTQGTVNQEYGQGALNREYSQGELNRQYNQGTVNQEYGQGELNRQYNQGTVNREYGQGELNRQYNQGTVNREYGQGELNRQYNQGTVNREYGQGTVNRQYNQGTVNREYGQGTVNRQYNQGTVNREYGQGELNREYGQGELNRQYNQGTVNREYNQGSLQRLQNDTVGVRLMEEGYKVNRYGLLGTTFEPESNQSRISSAKFYATSNSQDYPERKRGNISSATIGDSGITDMTTYKQILPRNQSLISMNSSPERVSMIKQNFESREDLTSLGSQQRNGLQRLWNGTNLKENVEPGPSTTKYDGLVSSEEITKVVLKPKKLSNITNVTKTPEILPKVKTSSDSEEQNAALGPLQPMKINWNQAMAAPNKPENTPSVIKMSGSTPDNALSVTKISGPTSENGTSVTTIAQSAPEDASTVIKISGPTPENPPTVSKIAGSTPANAPTVTKISGPTPENAPSVTKVAGSTPQNAPSISMISEPALEDGPAVIQILESKPETVSDSTPAVPNVTKTPKALSKHKTSSNSEEYSAAMGPLNPINIHLNHATVARNITTPENVPNGSTISDSKPEHIAHITQTISNTTKAPEILPKPKTASDSEEQHAALGPLQPKTINLNHATAARNTTTPEHISTVPESKPEIVPNVTKVLQSSDENPSLQAVITAKKNLTEPKAQPGIHNGSKLEDVSTTTNDASSSEVDNLSLHPTERKHIKFIPKIDTTTMKNIASVNVQVSTTEALKSSEESLRSTSPTPEMKPNEQHQGLMSTVILETLTTTDTSQTSDEDQATLGTTTTLKTTEFIPTNQIILPSTPIPIDQTSIPEIVETSEELLQVPALVITSKPVTPNERPQDPSSAAISETLTTTDTSQTSEEDQATLGPTTPKTTEFIPTNQITLSSTPNPKGQTSMLEIVETSEELPTLAITSKPLTSTERSADGNEDRIVKPLPQKEKAFSSEEYHASLGPMSLALKNNTMLHNAAIPKAVNHTKPLAASESDLNFKAGVPTMKPKEPTEQFSLPSKLLSTTETPSSSVGNDATLRPKNIKSPLSNRTNSSIIRQPKNMDNKAEVFETSEESFGSQGAKQKRLKNINGASSHIAGPLGLNSAIAPKISEVPKPLEKEPPTVLQKETTKKPEINNSSLIRIPDSSGDSLSAPVTKNEFSLVENEQQKLQNVSREKNDQNGPVVINNEMNQNNYFVVEMPNHNGTTSHQLKAVDAINEGQKISEVKLKQPSGQQIESQAEVRAKELQKSNSAEKVAPKAESQQAVASKQDQVKSSASIGSTDALKEDKKLVQGSNISASKENGNGKGSEKFDGKLKMKGSGKDNMESAEQVNHSEEKHKAGSKGGNAEGTSSKHHGHGKKSDDEDVSYEESIEYYYEESHENQGGGHAQHNEMSHAVKHSQVSQMKGKENTGVAAVNHGGGPTLIVHHKAGKQHPELMDYEEYEYYDYYSDEQYESQSSSHNTSSTSTSTKNSGTVINTNEAKSSKISGTQHQGASVTKASQPQSQGLEVQNESSLKLKPQAAKTKASGDTHSATAHSKSKASQSAHDKHTEAGHTKSQGSQSVQKKQTEGAHAKSQASQSTHKKLTDASNANSKGSQSAHKKLNGPANAKSQVSPSTHKKLSGKVHGSAKQTEYLSYEDDHETEYYSESSSSSFETFSHSSKSSSNVQSSSSKAASSSSSSSSSSTRGGSEKKVLSTKDGESKAQNSKSHSSAASKTNESQNRLNAKQSNSTRAHKTQEKSNIKVQLETSKGRKPN